MIDHEEYVERVLQCVEQVPRGRVTTYGAIAEVVGAVLGGGGPRLVGTVMANHGGPVPWWRVVRADGSLPPSHEGEARMRYLEEGTPLRPSGNVDIKRAAFRPELRAGRSCARAAIRSQVLPEPLGRGRRGLATVRQLTPSAEPEPVPSPPPRPQPSAATAAS